MKIVVDEGVERPIVVRLRADGHHVLYIAEVAPGSTDRDILELAHNEKALLITLDKDFGDLVFLHHFHTNGVILLRLPASLSSSEKARIVADVIREHQEALFFSFTVIASNKRRIIRIVHEQGHPELD
jgi:predicted nuclease of predicted toxin-antitoxin system